MQDTVRGHGLLRSWLEQQDITHEAAAERLGTNVNTLRSWLFKKRRPGLAAATVIETATASFVKRDDWLNDEELATARVAAAGNAAN